MHTSTRAGSVRAASGNHATGPAWGKLALIALTVAGLTAVWRYTPLHDYLTPERVFDWAQTFGGQWWAPLAVMVAVVYVLGMVTGGSLFSLLRRSIEGSKLMS